MRTVAFVCLAVFAAVAVSASEEPHPPTPPLMAAHPAIKPLKKPTAPYRVPAAVPAAAPAAPGAVQYVPPEKPVSAADAANIAAIVDTFVGSITREHAAGQPWLHQAHAKQHGCVEATLEVNQGVSDPRAYGGLFQPGKSYSTLIRFSNGVGRGFTATLHANESDILPDNRGMGIKIFGVPGAATSQVFTLTTAPFAFLPTTADALGFFQAIQKGNVATLGYLVEHPRVGLLYAKTAVTGGISDLLQTKWTAPVPNRHGLYTVKHHVQPCVQGFNGILPGLSFNSLRDQLFKTLAGVSTAQPFCLDWGVQFYADDSSTPVDDNTIEWNTPVISIAKLWIRPQPKWDSNHEFFCRYMSMTPDFTAPEHAGVGLTQKIRAAVYTRMAQMRHTFHGQPNRDVSFSDWVALGGANGQSPAATSPFNPRAPPRALGRVKAKHAIRKIARN